jgi:CxxC motif-containing protein (DUF1111 family)
MAGCAPENAENLEAPLAGGETTVADRTSHAFQNPAPNLSSEELDRHLAADVVFEATYVTAPAEVNPGLGPVYNNTACSACHVNNGRGRPVFGVGNQGSHLLVRVSDPAGEPAVPGGSAGLEGIGLQVADHAIYGHTPEAQIAFSWIEETGTYADGSAYSLRRPQLEVRYPDGSALPENTQYSIRLPPPVFGLGLLEAVSDSTLLALSDEDDSDGDGISGRVNQVWDAVSQSTVTGRFGLKANNPNLVQQAAGAFVNDMGVSNPVFSDDEGQADIDQETLDLAAFYTQSLAVPMRAGWDDPQVLAGEALFNDLGCVSCHVDTLESGDHPLPALRGQTFHPYTDLLLHDMGEGLADNRPDFEADGREWRTPPLWGIGLTETVLGMAAYLHDGRARTLEEAILWHGGEAQAARDAFHGASSSDRDALIAFLLSL